jgi:hypothetical protein
MTIHRRQGNLYSYENSYRYVAIWRVGKCSGDQPPPQVQKAASGLRNAWNGHSMKVSSEQFSITYEPERVFNNLALGESERVEQRHQGELLLQIFKLVILSAAKDLLFLSAGRGLAYALPLGSG